MYFSQECECICVHTGIGLLVWAGLLPDRKLNQVSPSSSLLSTSSYSRLDNDHNDLTLVPNYVSLTLLGDKYIRLVLDVVQLSHQFSWRPDQAQVKETPL